MLGSQVSLSNQLTDLDVLVKLKAKLLHEGCLSAALSESKDRPDIVATHPAIGVLAIQVAEEGAKALDSIKKLNRQIDTLRSDIPEIENVPLKRILACNDSDAAKLKVGPSTLIVHIDEIQKTRWINTLLEKNNVDADMLDAVAHRSQPTVLFKTTARRLAHDAGAPKRSAMRFALDAKQSRLALQNIDDVLVISGPPGSGKTLVLAARARWLAQEHPDWRIQILAYNRLLALHLANLVADYPNVFTLTFGKYAMKNGARISLNDEEKSNLDFERERKNGILPNIDALLIDEWQDFYPAWLRYALCTLRTGRGGACLAGDAKQAIYRQNEPQEALRGRKVAHVKLDLPYRSTRTILEIVGKLHGSFDLVSPHNAPNGPPVDLIRADDWNGQAHAIAWEIKSLLDSGERTPGSVGILVTQKVAILKRLERALEENNLPYKLIDGTQLPDPDSVSIVTVHQSKGYEFDVVFLMGLEALPKITGDADSQRRGRVGYVGPTRARDQLIITYTRQNEFLRNIERCPEDLLRVWNFPDDYEGV